MTKGRATLDGATAAFLSNGAASITSAQSFAFTTMVVKMIETHEHAGEFKEW
jgi:hypothetical protein